MKLLLILISLIFGTEWGHSVEEGIIQNKETRIFYRMFGHGTPVVIINGGPGMNSAGFEELATMLSTECRTIIYDQRGTGKSSLEMVDSSTITMDKMVDDLECLRRHLGIDRWIVLGHSFGGMLASYYAARFPQSISGMILSSSGGIDLDLLTYIQQRIDAKLSEAQLDSVRYWSERIANGDTSYDAKYRRGMALAPAYLVNKTYVPNIAKRLTQGNSVINYLVWENLNKIHFDCAPSLKNFPAPVLIIQGKEDIIDPSTAMKAHHAIPFSTLVFLDRCGHYGWLDNENEYRAHVAAFIHSIRN